jgi:lipopolysaccharide heptosyltransferase II
VAPDTCAVDALHRAARILILSPNWLGDAVMALPAIADVQRRFAPARVIVAARRAVAGLFHLAPAVDEVLPLEWNGTLLRRRALQNDLESLRRVSADAALLLPNSFASAWMVSRAGVPERMGYARDWRRRLLTRAVEAPGRSVHQAEYYQHLVRALDGPTGPLEPAKGSDLGSPPEPLTGWQYLLGALRAPRTAGRSAQRMPNPSTEPPSSPLLVAPDAAVATARSLLTSRGWREARPLVALAPGAAYGTAKRWLPAHFARLVAMLVSTNGATCVMVGSGADRATTTWIHGLVPEAERAHLVDLAGETSLESLAGVIRLSRAFVSNDSGAMHMASALGVPVAALFGPTREYETAPLPRSGVRAEVLLHPVWCRPCMLRECPIDHRCMKGLTPERVFATVREMMAGPEGPPLRTEARAQ